MRDVWTMEMIINKELIYGAQSHGYNAFVH